MGLLEGKVALITGAARGIGKAIALKFASEGADIAFTDLVINEAAEETVKEIEAFGHKVKAYASNAAMFEETGTVVEEILAEFGKIDILVNNAGITKDGLVMRMTEQQWDAVINVNLKSAFNFIHAVIPSMARQKSGSIINMASIAGQMGNPGQVNYASSKAGLIAMAKSVAKEMGSRGIRADSAPPRRHPGRHRQCGSLPRIRPLIICERAGNCCQRSPLLLIPKTSEHKLWNLQSMPPRLWRTFSCRDCVLAAEGRSEHESGIFVYIAWQTFLSPTTGCAPIILWRTVSMKGFRKGWKLANTRLRKECRRRGTPSPLHCLHIAPTLDSKRSLRR